MGSPIIWNGDSSKILTSNLKFKGNRKLLESDVNPTSTATSAEKGDLQITNKGVYRKVDSGSSTNWIKLNEYNQFKLYENFEDETVSSLPTGWTKYGNTNTALNYPDNFGGSVSASSYTTVANTALSGANVFRTAISSSDNGKGVYKPFSISNGEKGLPFIFESQINVTKTGSADWASNAQVWVVGSNDNFVSNFQNIPLTNYVVSKSGLLKGSFIDSSSTLTNFRLCIHFSGLTDTFNVDFDEVKIYQSNADTLSPNSKKVISSWGYQSGAVGGNASTNTRVMYITGVSISEQGGSYSDYFSYSQSSVLGDSWTAKSNFLLRVYISSDFSGTTESNIGISINSTQLTTPYHSLPSANKITVTGSYLEVGSGQGEILIKKGDILRIQTNNTNSPLMTDYFKLIFSIDENTGSNVIASSENFMPIKAVIPSQSVGAGATEISFTTAGDTRFTTSSRFKLPSNGRYLITLTYVHSAFPQWINFDVRKNGVALTGAKGNYRDMPSNLTNYNQGSLVLDTTGDSDSDYYSVWIGGQSSVTIGSDGNSNMQIDRLDKPFSMNLFQAAGMVLSPTDNVLPAKFGIVADQSMPNNTHSVINLETLFNPNGFILTSNKIYPMVAGYYELACFMVSTAQEGTAGFGLSIRVNGSEVSTTDRSGQLVDTYYLKNTDYIEILYANYTGVTKTLYKGLGTKFNVKRVDKTAVSAGGGYTKWQRKNFSPTLNGSLSFNNLEIGKTYKGSMYISVLSPSGNYLKSIKATHNSVDLKTITISQETNGASGWLDAEDGEILFVAMATSITFTVTSHSGSQNSTGYCQLEELPQHIQTNQWT